MKKRWIVISLFDLRQIATTKNKSKQDTYHLLSGTTGWTTTSSTIYLCRRVSFLVLYNSCNNGQSQRGVLLFWSPSSIIHSCLWVSGSSVETSSLCKLGRSIGDSATLFKDPWVHHWRRLLLNLPTQYSLPALELIVAGFGRMDALTSLQAALSVLNSDAQNKELSSSSSLPHCVFFRTKVSNSTAWSYGQEIYNRKQHFF